MQHIDWSERWQCGSCSVTHQRDDNAAINLARYEETSSVVGPVGAAVKRGADPKTGPRPAGGCEAPKGRSRKTAEQPPRRGASRVTTKDHSLATVGVFSVNEAQVTKAGLNVVPLSVLISKRGRRSPISLGDDVIGLVGGLSKRSAIGRRS
jgi:hypothetical protein